MDSNIDNTILTMSADEVQEYFLESEQFCNIKLPDYIDFTDIINFVRKSVGDKTLKEIKNQWPSRFQEVNYSLITNKDGGYAYRTFQIANPFLYYLLVREIYGNWSEIQKRFTELFDESGNAIEVLSIPPTKQNQDKTIVAASIRNWWQHVEQRSIELSLEYKYVFITDITNCYDSIYTHSIAWALHGKSLAKEKRRDDLLGNRIDKIIQEMQNGQTNGIPQGSVIFDFIAEMILTYADSLLVSKLNAKGIFSYKILRFRDDYRIFSNSKEELEQIVKDLQTVLASLNFHINTSKTTLSEKVIETSIKSDKLCYLSNAPIVKGEDSLFSTYQKELLFILAFSRKFPNSGTVVNLLSSLHRRLESNEDNNKHNRINSEVLIAIITEIALVNPKSIYLVIAIISCFLLWMEPNKAKEVLEKVKKKLLNVPNVGHWEIWLQRLTLPRKVDAQFNEKICQLI